MKIVDLHAPTKTKRVRNSFAPWLTPEVKELMHGRDHLKKIAQITNQQEDWSAYKQAKNNLNRVINNNNNNNNMFICTNLEEITMIFREKRGEKK